MLWTQQEIIWMVDGQILRRKPNYYCHSPLPVILSSAMIGGSPTKKAAQVVDEMNGQNFRINNLGTFRAD